MDVWACALLHNMYMRYRKRDYLLGNAEYRAEQALFAQLARTVIQEVDVLHVDEDQAARAALAAVGVDADRVPSVPVRGLSEDELRAAGVVYRDAVCAAMWASARAH